MARNDVPTPSTVPEERRAEYEGLVALLMAHAVPGDEDAERVAREMAAAALGPAHLWHDMGLASRGALRELFERHFPDFAAKNTKDMRWKKFMYKQLCGWEGFHA